MNLLRKLPSLAFASVFALFGLIALSMAFLILLPAASEELALVRSREAVQGVVTGLGGDESGESEDSFWVAYTYEVNGRRFSGRYDALEGKPFPQPYREVGSTIFLEYAPGDPGTSRPRGTGADSLSGWVGGKVFPLTMATLVGLVFTGVGMGLCLAQFWPEARLLRAFAQME